MEAKQKRDIDKEYPKAAFVAKLRRLADAIESGSRFEIRIEGERISVPVRAAFSIEHERSKDGEEIEFQIKWERASGAVQPPDFRVPNDLAPEATAARPMFCPARVFHYVFLPASCH